MGTANDFVPVRESDMSIIATYQANHSLETKILSSASSQKYHTVFLQVVSLSHDVRRNVEPIRQFDLGNLSLSRVGFLGLLDANVGNNALALLAASQSGCFSLPFDALASSTLDLIQSGLGRRCRMKLAKGVGLGIRKRRPHRRIRSA